MDIDLIIFDKDGTLIDIHNYWGGMLRLRAESLIAKNIITKNKNTIFDELISNMGIDTHTGKIKENGPVGIKPREFIINVATQTLQKYCPNIVFHDVSSVFDEIDIVSQYQLDVLVKPLPGVEKLLQNLQTKNIKMAIATTDLTHRAKLAMKSIGFLDYFDCIAGSNLVSSAKPQADLVNYIHNFLNIDGNKTIVIGDSMVDLKMAQNSNTKFIGVKTGLYSQEFIENSEMMVDDLTQVERLI